MGKERSRPAPARVHPRLQEHEDCEGDLRMAGRGQSADWNSSSAESRASSTRTGESTRSEWTPRWSTRPTLEGAKSDEIRWMRFTLDTVGKTNWPTDRQGRPLYPEGFEELAKKLERPLHPPGRDVRCIVSVGMLTEGWDCNTVTHIIGLRPFMSQLLCEQVVGRGLRRASYELGENGTFHRGSRQGLRRAVRGHPVQGESAGTCAAASEAISRPRHPGESTVRDSVSASRGLHAGDSKPRHGGLGQCAHAWCCSPTRFLQRWR